MASPHAWHFDQECIDIQRLPIHTNSLKWNNNTFVTSHKFCWIRNLATLPYYLLNVPIVVHSEQNSNAVGILENNGFATVHWFSHAALARDWFRYAEHDPYICHKTLPESYRFLIYNRAWSGTREYRLVFAEMLAVQGLLPYCKTSLSFIDNDKHYSQHTWRRRDWKTSLHFEDFFQTNNTTSGASADYESSDYQQQCIEVVLETIFDAEHVSLTEKSLRPMATATPFILAGPAHSLQYLRHYGFETFEPWINESYDLEPDAHKRLTMIVQELQRLARLDTISFRQVLNHCQQVAYRNRERFFHNNLQNQVFDEYKTGMQKAIARAKANIDVKLWSMVQHYHSPQQQQWVNDFVQGKILRNSAKYHYDMV